MNLFDFFGKLSIWWHCHINLAWIWYLYTLLAPIMARYRRDMPWTRIVHIKRHVMDMNFTRKKWSIGYNTTLCIAHFEASVHHSHRVAHAQGMIFSYALCTAHWCCLSCGTQWNSGRVPPLVMVWMRIPIGARVQEKIFPCTSMGRLYKEPCLNLANLRMSWWDGTMLGKFTMLC